MDPVHERGSMDPVHILMDMDRVHGGGPWTRGPCFVLSPERQPLKIVIKSLTRFNTQFRVKEFKESFKLLLATKVKNTW